MTQVLVFVPGLLGSELWDEEGKLWPGDLRDWAFGYPDDKFARLCTDDLRAPDILRQAVGIVDIYGSWIGVFEGLRDAQTGLPMFTEDGAKPTLLSAPYDWRKSIAVGAEAVAKAMKKAVELHGNDVQIHIAAHSMGGLVARYFLQCGTYDALGGFDRIQSLLTFGAPHLGAVVALAAALGQRKTDFLSLQQSKTLANDPRFRGLYDLFPQAGSRPLWKRGGSGRLEPRDIFDPTVCNDLKLNADSLRASQEIHQVLARPWPAVRTFLFVGSRFETMTHVLWDGVNAAVVKTPDGGDGTVNLQGAMPQSQQIRLTDKNHTTLISAEETRGALQDFFDARGIALAAQATMSLIPAENFVPSSQPIEVLLAVSGPSASVHGKLFLERARIPASAFELNAIDFDGARPEAERELRYDGPELTSLNIKFDGITGPAALRPVFETFDEPPRRFEGPTFLVTATDQEAA